MIIVEQVMENFADSATFFEKLAMEVQNQSFKNDPALAIFVSSSA